MILVGQFDSPYVRRVAVALHLLGIPYERSPLSVFGDADALRRINPVGRVPALVLDDGEAIVDSGAILDHLDELAGPERALLPARGAARRLGLRIGTIATGTSDKVGSIVYEHVLRPPHLRYAPWLARCRVQVDTGLQTLEAMTGDGWYLGERPMQPDLTVVCMIGHLRARIPEAFPDGAYPRIAKLVAAAEALDAFRRALPSPDETVPVAPTA